MLRRANVALAAIELIHPETTSPPPVCHEGAAKLLSVSLFCLKSIQFYPRFPQKLKRP